MNHAWEKEKGKGEERFFVGMLMNFFTYRGGERDGSIL